MKKKLTQGFFLVFLLWLISLGVTCWLLFALNDFFKFSKDETFWIIAGIALINSVFFMVNQFAWFYLKKELE